MKNTIIVCAVVCAVFYNTTHSMENNELNLPASYSYKIKLSGNQIRVAKAKEEMARLRPETKLPQSFNFEMYVTKHSDAQVNAFMSFVQKHTTEEIKYLIAEITLIEEIAALNEPNKICFNYLMKTDLEEIITSIPAELLLFNINVDHVISTLPLDIHLFLKIAHATEDIKNRAYFLKKTLLNAALLKFDNDSTNKERRINEFEAESEYFVNQSLRKKPRLK